MVLMRPIASLVLLLALAGCHPGQPALATCDEAINPHLVIDRCMNGDPVRGHYIGDTACFPFEPQETMTGLWRVSIGHSAFISDSSDEDGGDRTWLEATDIPPVVRASMQGDTPRSFLVTLVGRRSSCPAFFGHQGMSPNEVITDHFVSVKPVG